MARIYLASSWRNEEQPSLVAMLKEAGHQVYDFRNPPAKVGFKWSDIELEWKTWSKERYCELLTTSEQAAHGFLADYRAMQWADTCVLALPCGRSAHLEAGYFNGVNKRLIIYMPLLQEPELMYLMANEIVLYPSELVEALK